MIKRLFIAEKPSLGKAIASGLSSPKKEMPTHIICGDDVVTWGFGHIYEADSPEDYDKKWEKWTFETLPIYPPGGHFKRHPKKDSLAQIKAIKELMKEAEVIVNAGDPDREGQLLIDEILEELKWKKETKRLLLNAVDKKSVAAALADIRSNNDKEFIGWREEAEARMRADWLHGMNLSRFFSMIAKQFGGAGVFSIGRVQTPTLGLVVQRDLDIEGFKESFYYTLSANFSSENNQSIKMKWSPNHENASFLQLKIDKEKRIVGLEELTSLADSLKGKQGFINKFTKDLSKEQPPLPYSLDTLQVDCSNQFKLTAIKTLEIAQSLYEKKYTTYPRTDCPYLPESQFEAAEECLSALAEILAPQVSSAIPQLKSKAWDDRKTAAHHGIIPTGVTAKGLSPDEEKVYKLICLRYVAQFYPEAEYDVIKVEACIENELFAFSSRKLKVSGWKDLYSKFQSDDSDDEDDKEGNSDLLDFNEGDSITLIEPIIEKIKPKPKKPFTQASLIQAMKNAHQFESDPEIKKRLKESKGIGTTATQANIIETLTERGYVTSDKKNIIKSTEKGRSLIASIPKILYSPGFTAMVEEKLSEIAKGTLSKDDFVEKQFQFIQSILSQRSAHEKKFFETSEKKKCPKCSDGWMFKKTIKSSTFWGCNQYPKCDGSSEVNSSTQKKKKTRSKAKGMSFKI